MKDNRLVEMQVFRAVADAGGFTAAAHLLGVSQPFVSQTLHALERRLGVQLLHRSTRVQRLTAEGETYLATCRRLLDDIERCEAAVGPGEPRGTLRVTAPRAFGLDQIVPLLPGFLSAHPAIDLQLSLSDAHANLLEDQFDVAVRMGRLPDSSLHHRVLCPLRRVVVASPAYLARRGTPQRPEDLLSHEGLLWQGPLDHLNRWRFLQDGQLRELSPTGRLRSSDGSALFRLCLAGMGVMRLAEHLALPAIRRGELTPLLTDFDAGDDGAVHAVFLPERQLVPRIRVFVDHLVAAFASPPWVSG